MGYSKYYDLENYLFSEVCENFLKRGYLTAAEFFCIVIWKANRAKTKIKKKLTENGTVAEVVRKITEQIFEAKKADEKLNILLKKWDFGMPMATAILSVLFPSEFTVYDYRVRDQLGLKSIYSTKKYFDYFLPMVHKAAKEYNKTLRETDKELWGKSFFQDLERLLE